MEEMLGQETMKLQICFHCTRVKMTEEMMGQVMIKRQGAQMAQHTTGCINSGLNWPFAPQSKIIVIRVLSTTDIHAQRTMLNRIWQSGTFSVMQQRNIETEIKALEE